MQLSTHPPPQPAYPRPYPTPTQVFPATGALPTLRVFRNRTLAKRVDFGGLTYIVRRLPPFLRPLASPPPSFPRPAAFPTAECGPRHFPARCVVAWGGVGVAGLRPRPQCGDSAAPPPLPFHSTARETRKYAFASTHPHPHPPTHPPTQDPANYTLFLRDVLADPATAPRGGYERPPGGGTLPLSVSVAGAL